MYQKREERKNKPEVEKAAKININWYPGHMTKAKREMQTKLKMVDMIIELRDARIPNASKNPMIDELANGKPRLVILSKADKAQPNATKEWITYLVETAKIDKVISANILKDNMVKIITEEAKLLMKDKIERQIRRGIKPRPIRAMVVGVPNVGKSTLINAIAKKKVTIAANRPGVTRALQWAKINSDIELLDTPGVLWPKFEDQHIGMLLAVSGAIKDDILPIEEVCYFAMNYLIKYYPNSLIERYGITIDDDPNIVINNIAIKRQFLLANGEINEKRTIDTIMKEIRGDAIGCVTWELPDANTK
ncbi:MAG: ribosome biogenesis GTPase YlqF [Erysipelotrichaceae bacterium]